MMSFSFRLILFLFERFPSEVNVGHISADTLWKLLSVDLKDHLEGNYYFYPYAIRPEIDFILLGITFFSVLLVEKKQLSNVFIL